VASSILTSSVRAISSVAAFLPAYGRTYGSICVSASRFGVDAAGVGDFAATAFALSSTSFFSAVFKNALAVLRRALFGLQRSWDIGRCPQMVQWSVIKE
jgi:hypothetical protein